MGTFGVINDAAKFGPHGKKIKSDPDALLIL